MTDAERNEWVGWYDGPNGRVPVFWPHVRVLLAIAREPEGRPHGGGCSRALLAGRLFPCPHEKAREMVELLTDHLRDDGMVRRTGADRHKLTPAGDGFLARAARELDLTLPDEEEDDPR